MLHTVIFIGRSGCGKGTQANLLKERIASLDPEKREILYVETGEYFREFVKGESYTSKLSKVIYEEDRRQPDFLGSWMWSEMLVRELRSDMHIVFDGVARAYSEALLLSTALKFYERILPTVVYLNVGRKWAEERLLRRGRLDDKTLEKINKRLDWFDTDTWPAIEYFKVNPFYKFIEINGEQTIEKVHTDIVTRYGDSS
jgi:adenylate kinase family enzyme